MNGPNMYRGWTCERCDLCIMFYQGDKVMYGQCNATKQYINPYATPDTCPYLKSLKEQQQY